MSSIFTKSTGPLIPGKPVKTLVATVGLLVVLVGELEPQLVKRKTDERRTGITNNFEFNFITRHPLQMSRSWGVLPFRQGGRVGRSVLLVTSIQS